MRTFDHPNISHGWRCPVCMTQADKPVTLAAIPGTWEDGIVQAEQIHVECYELLIRMAAVPAPEDETR